MKYILCIGTLLACIAITDACARDSCAGMGSPHSVARCVRESEMPD